ncbi:MAG: glycosyltransferase [Sediminibacterium sp.]|jgi:glycosyltransferase involved in cell wall biosynthesis
MQNADRLCGRDIVIVGQQPWDTSIGSNCKNIALEWSKYNRVLYVNAALDRFSWYTAKNDLKIQQRLSVIRGEQEGLVVIQENLWNLFPNELIESINWIPNQFLFELFNKSNNKKFAKSIQYAIDALSFTNIILFNDNDMFRSYHLKELLHPLVSIYYSRDFMLAVDYWKKHGLEMEPKLITKSNICVANSTYLAAYCKKYNPNSFDVGQGCDLESFSNANTIQKPADMLCIPAPIIGYVGALQSIRLDLQVLMHIATSKPEWNIVLVGPEDNVFANSTLHQLKNVYFIGAKDPAELPAYINAFDVCINPQLVNQVTIGNYPRKIDEYLAVGKPVVASKTDAMSIFSNYCFLTETKQDYVEKIQEAIDTDSKVLRAHRKSFAATHTWQNSVKAIDHTILNYISN